MNMIEIFQDVMRIVTFQPAPVRRKGKQFEEHIPVAKPRRRRHLTGGWSFRTKT